MRVVHQTNRHVLPCHTLMALLGMGMPKPLEEFSRGDHPVNGALLATCLSHFFSPLQSTPPSSFPLFPSKAAMGLAQEHELTKAVIMQRAEVSGLANRSVYGDGEAARALQRGDACTAG